MEETLSATVSLKHAVTRRDAVTVNNPAGDALRDWSSAGWPPRRHTGRIRRRDTPGGSACRCRDN